MIHYVKGLNPYYRVKVQATLYEGNEIVKADQECNWGSLPSDSS